MYDRDVRYVDSLRRLVKVINGLEVNWLSIDYLLDGYNVVKNENYILDALYAAIDLGKPLKSRVTFDKLDLIRFCR